MSKSARKPRRHIYDQFVRRTFDTLDDVTPHDVWQHLGSSPRDLHTVHRVLKELLKLGLIEKVCHGIYRKVGTEPLFKGTDQPTATTTRHEFSKMPSLAALDYIPNPTPLRDRIVEALRVQGPSTTQVIQDYIDSRYQTRHALPLIAASLVRLIAKGRVRRDGAKYTFIR